MFSSRLMQFFQYKYLKYLTVDMINDKYRIEGSEAAADDRLLPTQAKLALYMANTDNVGYWLRYQICTK
jgi:hypothetical protein